MRGEVKKKLHSVHVGDRFFVVYIHMYLLQSWSHIQHTHLHHQMACIKFKQSGLACFYLIITHISYTQLHINWEKTQGANQISNLILSLWKFRENFRSHLPSASSCSVCFMYNLSLCVCMFYRFYKSWILCLIVDQT